MVFFFLSSNNDGDNGPVESENELVQRAFFLLFRTESTYGMLVGNPMRSAQRDLKFWRRKMLRDMYAFSFN